MDYEKLLQNPVFIARYLNPNISWYRSYLKGNRGIARIYRFPFAWFYTKFFSKNYFKKRVLAGKVDIPYIEIVLTTKCTLRCECCMNLMQYFSSSNQYTCTLEGIKNSINALLNQVDSIQRLRIIGGEPLLFKDLPKVVEFLGEQKKIRSFDILTNATIDFSDEIIKTLKQFKNARICISDYTNSPNIKIPLKSNSIIKKLKENKITFNFMAAMIWFKTEKIYKRNRSKEDIIRNFRACNFACVSLMSAEGKMGGGINENLDAHKLAPNGAIFVCPIASSLSRLKGLEEFQGDFISLGKNKDDFFKFYANDFFKACDYCMDYTKPKVDIPPAIQTTEIFNIERS